MAFKLFKKDNFYNGTHQEFLIDDANDLEEIEKNFDCELGDKAHAPDGKIYARHSDGWEEDLWGIFDNNGGILPSITNKDNGNVLTANNGKWKNEALPQKGYDYQESTYASEEVVIKASTTTRQYEIGDVLVEDYHFEVPYPEDGDTVTYKVNDFSGSATVSSYDHVRLATLRNGNLIFVQGEDGEPDYAHFDYFMDATFVPGNTYTFSFQLIHSESEFSSLYIRELSDALPFQKPHFSFCDDSGYPDFTLSKITLDKTLTEVANTIFSSNMVLFMLRIYNGNTHIYSVDIYRCTEIYEYDYDHPENNYVKFTSMSGDSEFEFHTDAETGYLVWTVS